MADGKSEDSDGSEWRARQKRGEIGKTRVMRYRELRRAGVAR